MTVGLSVPGCAGIKGLQDGHADLRWELPQHLTPAGLLTFLCIPYVYQGALPVATTQMNQTLMMMEHMALWNFT